MFHARNCAFLGFFLMLATTQVEARELLFSVDGNIGGDSNVFRRSANADADGLFELSPRAIVRDTQDTLEYEFSYRPTKCSADYRLVVLRKTISVKQGQALLMPEVRYHFYITNEAKAKLSARQVIRESNERCNQENLIEQTKNGVHAMRDRP